MKKDRNCTECGKAFYGDTKKCLTCRTPPRQCEKCGAITPSRYRNCRRCRTVLKICDEAGCDNPKAPGRGGKLCQEHRDTAYARRLERMSSKNECSFGDCHEPRIIAFTETGRRRPYQYCEKHSGEAPARERARIAQRARERKYGMTEQQYQATLAKQGGNCAICGKHAQKRQLSVDHNHRTGVTRGLLCDRCNPLLGYARDDTAVLQAAIEYLNSWE